MMSSEEIEQRIRCKANPFDLLRYANMASVLELGAGDLSFTSELFDLYVPELQQQNRQLILHCLDRLDPTSKLGGPLHPERDRVRALQEKVKSTFAFFGNQDILNLRNLEEGGELAPRYAIVTCSAPAAPTFAYEPTRLSQSVIDTQRDPSSRSDSEVSPGSKFSMAPVPFSSSLGSLRSSVPFLSSFSWRIDDRSVCWAQSMPKLFGNFRRNCSTSRAIVLKTNPSPPQTFRWFLVRYTKRSFVYQSVTRSTNRADLGTLRRQFPPAGLSTSANHFNYCFSVYPY